MSISCQFFLLYRYGSLWTLFPFFIISRSTFFGCVEIVQQQKNNVKILRLIDAPQLKTQAIYTIKVMHEATQAQQVAIT